MAVTCPSQPGLTLLRSFHPGRPLTFMHGTVSSAESGERDTQQQPEGPMPSSEDITVSKCLPG